MTAQPYAFHADIAAEAVIPARGIHSQTLSDADGIELVLFAMAPGEQLAEHTSSRPAILHFLRGDGRLSVAGAEHGVRPGSWLRMAADTPHSLLARSGLVFALYLLPRASD